MDKLSYLARINVMKELPHEALAEIAHSAPMITAPRGTLIMNPAEPRPVLYLLKQGRVRLYKMNADGRQFTLGLLGEGNIFGETGTFSTGTRDAYAEALADCVICVLHKSDAERVLQAYPNLALRLLEAVSDRLREAEELLGQLAMGDVRARVLYLLLRLGHKFGVPEGAWTRISAGLTHQEIASMVGATRETVSLTLSTLEREGIVRTGRKEVWVHRESAGQALGADGIS